MVATSRDKREERRRGYIGSSCVMILKAVASRGYNAI